MWLTFGRCLPPYAAISSTSMSHPIAGHGEINCSQGASQAIEDAAVIAQCLRQVPLDKVGKAFQDLRYSRATQIQQNARRQKTANHYPDGPEQQRRDESLKDPANVRSWTWEPIEGQPFKSWNEGLFGYDTQIECQAYFQKMGYLDLHP